MGRHDRSAWLESLCRIPLELRSGGKSVYQLFTEANPDLTDRTRFLDLVADRLKNDPVLVDAWQNYSYDKRVDHGPYLDGTKVGDYEGGKFLRKSTHAKPAIACADFIFREAQLVLDRDTP